MDYVYLWADGIHVNIRLEEHELCLLVMIGVRAEPYAYGAPEYVELELYLMWRARGMKLETPAVRP